MNSKNKMPGCLSKVDAIPVEWIENYIGLFPYNEERQRYLKWMVEDWRRENADNG